MTGAARPGAPFCIRAMRPEDNAAVARIIRQVMTEFGAVGGDFSIADAEVDAMYEAYPAPAAAFFVVEAGASVLGCGGMGPLTGGEPEVCELRKMSFLPELRGNGMGGRLLARIVDAAREAGYRQCYLDTLDNMDAARRLYLRHGFEPIDAPLGDTGHSGCNRWMVRKL